MKELFEKNNDFIPEDAEYIQDNYGFDEDLARLFSSRGVTADNADRYFNFDEENIYDPFLMKGMDKAVPVIKNVMSNGGKILVYGDYDADGLTASSILKSFFTNNGTYCDILIPTRDEGYGMHVENVFDAFSKTSYDLILTVDCGISNKEEIAVLTEKLGVPVIVTDHHEVPPVLPDCICINPKLGYPFPSLAGAGVAWKLVQALAGYKHAKKYADLAMVGTVADMMPLVDENRDIVILGLQQIKHAGLLKLAECSNCSKPYTASDIALRIAPKINAAGRVGDPTLALEVLLMQDAADEIAVKNLIAVNEERKCLVDETVKSAESKLDTKEAIERGLIFLYDENWKNGILGIVANRFKEMYGVPAVIMTRDGENYVGSARSSGINLFALFEAVSGLLVKYGGHKSSVGFTVSKGNLLALKERLTEGISACEMTQSVVCYYDLDFDEKYLIKENYEFLSLLEPVLPNDKAVFYADGYAKIATLFGSDKNHLKLTLDSGLELKGFYKYTDFYDPLNSGAECEVLFNLEYDPYSKRVQGIITNMRLKNSLHFDELYVRNLIGRLIPGEREFLTREQAEAVLKSDSALAVFASYYEYETAAEIFDFSDYTVFYFVQNNYAPKAVLISPSNDTIFSRYTNIVVFGDYNGFKPAYSTSYLSYQLQEQLPSYMGLRVDRSVCAAVYKALAQNNKAADLKSLYFKSRLSDITYAQFFAAVKIFQELSLLRIEEPFGYELIAAEKTELALSKLFRLFNKVD